MSVVYEWRLETRTSYEDEDEIIDTYADELPILIQMALEGDLEEGEFYRICLVRDRLDKFTSVEERFWAYVKGGNLPELFEDAFGLEASKVPKQYHEEFKKATKVNNPF